LTFNTRGILRIEFLNASSFLLLDNGLEGVLQEKARGLAYIEWLKDIRILLRGLRSME
jgi:hypothetical protein